MASLTEIKGLTKQLVAKAQEVQKQFDQGDLDFARLVRLTDEVGMEADRLAALFAKSERGVRGGARRARRRPRQPRGGPEAQSERQVGRLERVALARGVLA